MGMMEHADEKAVSRILLARCGHSLKTPKNHIFRIGVGCATFRFYEEHVIVSMWITFDWAVNRPEPTHS